MVNIFNSSKDDEKDDEAIKQIHKDLQEIAQELKVSNTHAMVHNALLLLESQYNIPDSIMSVDESIIILLLQIIFLQIYKENNIYGKL